ncbi:MAG: hypothetical protein QOI62_1476 [Solirubrobacteraceae bacterium]|nr:hypothetical protein [Solirubrobacteraceae bacterium]
MLQTAREYVESFVHPPPSIPDEVVSDLARSQLNDVHAVVNDLYTWKRERDLHFAAGAFKASALLLTPLLAAALASPKRDLGGLAVTLLASALTLSILGGVWMKRAAATEGAYGEAVMYAVQIRKDQQPQ